MDGGSCDSVRRRAFSGLSFLAGDKSLELMSELFPFSRCGPDSVVRGSSNILRGRRFEFDRGHFVNDVQRAGFR